MLLFPKGLTSKKVIRADGYRRTDRVTEARKEKRVGKLAVNGPLCIAVVPPRQSVAHLTLAMDERTIPCLLSLLSH